MPVRCKLCGSSDLHTSHFRLEDFALLFILQYPVRCRTCFERSYAFVWHVRKIARATRIRHRRVHRSHSQV